MEYIEIIVGGKQPEICGERMKSVTYDLFGQI